MKHARLVAAFACLAGFALAGEKAAPRFTHKPAAKRAGAKVKIAFAAGTPTDVEAGVLDAKGKVIRHLAAGILGGKSPPPAPLEKGLVQSLEWDMRDDFGKPAANGPFRVRVRASLRSGREPIKEIAARLGIADVLYFTRLFKRRFGLPPARYRNEHHEWAAQA